MDTKIISVAQVDKHSSLPHTSGLGGALGGFTVDLTLPHHLTDLTGLLVHYNTLTCTQSMLYCAFRIFGLSISVRTPDKGFRSDTIDTIF